MSNALLTDVEARAERRRTRTRDDLWQDLVRQALRHAAATPADARRWLERAHRLMPNDGTVALALAIALLAEDAWAEAEPLFQTLTDRYGTPEAWAGLATCAHLRGNAAQARLALTAALRCSVPTSTLRTLADAVAGPSGWCGIDTEGLLHSGVTQPTGIKLDGRSIAGRRLPDGWRRAAVLEIEGPHGPMLGSPLTIRVFAGVEGYVEVSARGVQGWAWVPADPGHAPTLHATGPLGTHELRATKPAELIQSERPLHRPRRFALTAAEVGTLGEPLSITGRDGRHLLGSPLAPGLEALAASSPARANFAPIWADVTGPTPSSGPTLSSSLAPSGLSRAPVDVLIPVYGGLKETLGCLDSVLATVPRGTQVIVIDDASPDAALVARLQQLARKRRIVLLRLPENKGFPGASNAGLRAAGGHDAVLLNSDTLVPPGWLERLRDAAYSAPDIGTVTPLTNVGSIVSYPDPDGANPPSGLAATCALDILAQKANCAATVDLPVGVGFCLYLRRDFLDQVGLLREDLFAQGYGEENDLCLRARHHGWRNVAAPGVFVAHAGATSFGPARAHLIRRNTAILNRLHPGYDALIANHVTADPLQPARLRMDALRWAAGRRRAGAVILVTHGGGGGVERVVTARARAIAETGRRPIVLRPYRTSAGKPAVRVEQPGGEAFPNLIYPIPDALAALVKLLRPDRVGVVEQHHLLGHDHALTELATRLGVEAVAFVHDYARFCPRIALVSTERRYCGEPDVPGCEACIADLGSLLEDDPPVRLLLDRSARELAQAAGVIAPSADTAIRLSRHFPGIRPTVEPWEDDAALPPLMPTPRQEVCRTVVVGAIGVEKGFEVLLACARDARARSLPIEYVVVGFTTDDERLMAAGSVFITGEYREHEAIELIRKQQAHIAFIPSVWPETWCFALSLAWQAGLPTAVFDLGAQAERVRNTGRGWVLPLGLSPRAVNDTLLRLAPVATTSHSLGR